MPWAKSTSGVANTADVFLKSERSGELFTKILRVLCYLLFIYISFSLLIISELYIHIVLA